MATVHNVGVFVGSIRKDSFNRKMAHVLAALAPESLKLSIIEIGHLPFYNQDDDANPSAVWTAYRQQIKALDAVLFVTPEYNRSMPGVLKNAIDGGSRPYGSNAFDRKPGAVISVSVGAIGGFGANHHLRQSLMFLNVPAMQQPEAYIGNAGALFDDSGKITKDETREFLKGFLQTFVKWIGVNRQT
ncbi:MAG TPA: NADPH-dependent FMN reductase [Aestuariivirga sp.]|nr:NADPH-dependent FMN reductase [Aestuariivirga sp.]